MIVTPHDCVLAFGIPTCQGGFEQRLKYGTSDYARRYSNKDGRGIWYEYYVSFVQVLNELEPGLRDIGVTVAHNVTSEEFSKLFKKYRVIILFSHWKNEDKDFPLGAVELDEGLVDIDTIVDAVPQDYDGFLDLCVCHPENLPSALLTERPKCSVKYLHHAAKPDIAFIISYIFNKSHKNTQAGAAYIIKLT